jgi:hypothetical protein
MIWKTERFVKKPMMERYGRGEGRGFGEKTGDGSGAGCAETEGTLMLTGKGRGLGNGTGDWQQKNMSGLGMGIFEAGGAPLGTGFFGGSDIDAESCYFELMVLELSR